MSKCGDNDAWGALDSQLHVQRVAGTEPPCILACHTCPALDDQTLFPDKVVENIVTANLEAKKLLRLLRSPFACGNFDKASQVQEFMERFVHLTDICSPAALVAKQKLEEKKPAGIENWLESRAPAGGAADSVAAARASREKRVALEESVRAVWKETRQLCECTGCPLPQPLPARQSDVSKSSAWDQALRSIERALRECNRSCAALGIGTDDAGLAVKTRAAH